MRRFEITYGPDEFAHFDTAYECAVDMVTRVGAMVRQAGMEPAKTLMFTSPDRPRIRVVCIAREVAA